MAEEKQSWETVSKAHEARVKEFLDKTCSGRWIETDAYANMREITPELKAITWMLEESDTVKAALNISRGAAILSIIRYAVVALQVGGKIKILKGGENGGR